MIDSFLKNLASEKRLSHHTVVAYRTDLLQFRDFLATNFDIHDLASVDYTMVRTWIVSLVESGIDPSSVNRKIASLRAFFRFLLAREIISQDPTRKLFLLKTKKRLPGFVKEDDMVNLLDNHRFPETFEGHRDRLVLEMFYATGIRLSELLHLKEKSIDFHSRTIKVLGKRNKERIIPFPAALTAVIHNYIAARNREITPQAHGNLFVRRDGAPCYPVLIYNIVRKYLGGLTSVERRSPHILRHTYATHLLNKGAELNAVKDLLGHSSLAATQIYTHNSMEKLKKVFEQAHPKA